MTTMTTKEGAAQIDARVAQRYGLADEEIAIVEGR